MSSQTTVNEFGKWNSEITHSVANLLKQEVSMTEVQLAPTSGFID